VISVVHAVIHVTVCYNCTSRCTHSHNWTYTPCHVLWLCATTVLVAVHTATTERVHRIMSCDCVLQLY